MIRILIGRESGAICEEARHAHMADRVRFASPEGSADGPSAGCWWAGVSRSDPALIRLLDTYL